MAALPVRGERGYTTSKQSEAVVPLSALLDHAERLLVSADFERASEAAAGAARGLPLSLNPKP